MNTNIEQQSLKNNIYSSSQSLIHTINLLGTEIIGIELGVGSGRNLFTILENCPNIQTLYGVDRYIPYKDYIKKNYDEVTFIDMDDEKITVMENEYNNKMDYYNYDNKINLIKKSSEEAVLLFEDNFFDFIFLDAYIDKESIMNDLRWWYPKLKINGLFSGHDIECDLVEELVKKFSVENNIKYVSIFNSCWCWLKC